MKSTNFQIALKHLTSRVKQVLVAVLSVTFGISMYIFMNGFMNGVNDIQSALAFSTLSHIRVYNDLPEDKTDLLSRYFGNSKKINLRNAKVIQYTEGIKNSQKIIHLVKGYDDVKGVTPQVNMNVFYRNGSTKASGLLSGVDALAEDQLFETASYVTDGKWDELKYRMDGLVMGKGLAEKLSLRLYDNVVVSTSDGADRSFKVIGLLETTVANVDNAKAYVNINAARQLISKNQSYVTDIQINVNDFNESVGIANAMTADIPFKVEAWQEANGQLQAGNDLRGILAIAVSLTILLVAGFGIYNIMNMTVNEKIKEIAILKAMGFEGGDIVQIFLIQSIIIGIIGGFIGLVFGYIVSFIVNHIPFNVASLETLPMSYRIHDYGLAFMFGLITTFLAGYLPAKKASEIDPVEIIRG